MMLVAKALLWCWLVMLVGVDGFSSLHMSAGHAIIVQNKGGGHGEIGFHLAKKLVDRSLTVTLLQDATAKKDKLPFRKYTELPWGTSVTWCALGDVAAIENALEGKPPVTHIFDNFAKAPGEAAPYIEVAQQSTDFKCYAFVSSAGMYKSKGLLKETDEVKESGQRQVEQALAESLAGQWCAFRPQYIYGPYTNKRDYLDWFLARAVRNLPMAVPGDAQQPVSITHCEDVAALIASVVGKELEAGGQIFNCGTDKLVSYGEVCATAAKAVGRDSAVVATLPPGTKSSFPFRPNAEGFAVRVNKVKDILGWPGATHFVLDDILGFYKDDFFELGLDQGDLDTSVDMLQKASNLDYMTV